MSELRQRKFARTRFALAQALAQSLSGQSLSDVPVKTLCSEAEVSEATFFNYFARKQDLVSYLVQLWMLESGWYATFHDPADRGLPVIEKIFAQSARNCARSPGLFREILIWIGQGSGVTQPLEFSDFEKRLAFPDLQRIEEVPVRDIDTWILPHLEFAIEQGVLPDNTLRQALLTSLLTILLGVPMVLLARDPARIAATYRQQLALLWAGSRAAARGERS